MAPSYHACREGRKLGLEVEGRVAGRGARARDRERRTVEERGRPRGQTRDIHVAAGSHFSWMGEERRGGVVHRLCPDRFTTVFFLRFLEVSRVRRRQTRDLLQPADPLRFPISRARVMQTTSTSAPPAVATTASPACPSPTPVTPTLSRPCRRRKRRDGERKWRGLRGSVRSFERRRLVSWK